LPTDLEYTHEPRNSADFAGIGVRFAACRVTEVTRVTPVTVRPPLAGERQSEGTRKARHP